MLYFAGKCYMNPTMHHKDTFVGKASSQTHDWLEVKPKSHSTVSCVTCEGGAAMNLEVMQLYISQWFTDSRLIKMWVFYFSCPLSVCYWWARNCIRVYNRVEFHLPLFSTKINHFQSCADKLRPLPSLNQAHLTTSSKDPFGMALNTHFRRSCTLPPTAPRLSLSVLALKCTGAVQLLKKVKHLPGPFSQRVFSRPGGPN